MNKTALNRLAKHIYSKTDNGEGPLDKLKIFNNIRSQTARSIKSNIVHKNINDVAMAPIF